MWVDVQGTPMHNAAGVDVRERGASPSKVERLGMNSSVSPSAR